MDLEMDLLEVDLSTGYDASLEHDYDFQCFDDIVGDELGYNVKEDPNARWTKAQKFPYVYRRLTDDKPVWANKTGSALIAKTKRFKWVKFDGALATQGQKDTWNRDLKAAGALLAKPAPKPTTVSPIGKNPDTKWSALKGFPYLYRRKTDNRRVWTNKKGAAWLKKRYPDKFNFVKFDGNLATTNQKNVWNADLKAVAQLAVKPPTALKPAPKAPVVPKGITQIAGNYAGSIPKLGYPYSYTNLATGKTNYANEPGWSLIKKDPGVKWVGFDKSLATGAQKDKWDKILVATAKAFGVHKEPLPKRLAVTPKGMGGDILDIKRMLQYAELQRQATFEHEQIAETKSFRRNVLDRLMRIAESVLSDDHPVYKRLARAR